MQIRTHVDWILQIWTHVHVQWRFGICSMQFLSSPSQVTVPGHAVSIRLLGALHNPVKRYNDENIGSPSECMASGGNGSPSKVIPEGPRFKSWPSSRYVLLVLLGRTIANWFATLPRHIRAYVGQAPSSGCGRSDFGEQHCQFVQSFRKHYCQLVCELLQGYACLSGGRHNHFAITYFISSVS